MGIQTRIYNANARTRKKNLVSNYHEHDLKNALLFFGYCCPYCGTSLHKKHWHLDHIVPVANGDEFFGSTAYNILPVCAKCNRKKGIKELEIFLKKSPQRLEKIYAYQIQMGINEYGTDF